MLKQCTFAKDDGYQCGSYAFNLRNEGIDQGDFCDTHYWQTRAEKAEAAIRFSVSPSTVSTWIAKAKSSGLLLPTNQSSRERGKGEVYGLGGALLNTVKTAEQEPNKNRTRTEQADTSEQTSYDALPNKNRTRTEQEPNAYRSTPDTPSAKPTTPRPRTAKVTGLVTVPEAFIQPLTDLVTRWPRSFTTKTGERVPLRGCRVPQDLYERMLKFFPHDSVAEMIECGFRHLNGPEAETSEWDFATPKKPSFTIAMNNFYGQEARWKEFRQ